MPSTEEIQGVYEQYVAAWSRLDIDAVLGLFAPDAVVDDPVDGPALEGVEADPRDPLVWSCLRAGRETCRPGPRRDCRHAAACIEVEEDLADGIKVLEAIDVWSFDDDGRISTMNAYFGPTNVRDA